MRNLKTLYVRNVLEDLIKKKVAVGIFIRDLRSPVRNARNRPGRKGCDGDGGAEAGDRGI